MNNELTVQNAFTKEQVELIKKTVAVGATDDELKLFLTVTGSRGLDPFTRQVHFIKRKVWNGKTGTYEERGTIQTGIDGYRTIASRTGELAGIDDAAYDTESETHPNKATVTVWRMTQGGRYGYAATARWAEYVQEGKDGQPSGLWKKMPYLMLAKCAESLALRKAFPAELSGIYTNEEMQQAEPPESVAVQATPVPRGELLTDAQRTKIWAMAGEKGVTTEAMNARAMELYGVRVSSLTKEQAAEVIEKMAQK